MKIKVSELRKVIREEIRRAMTMNETLWGDETMGMDHGLAKIKRAFKVLTVTPPKITKTMDETPTYWFNIMNLPDEEVQWVTAELQSIPGATVSEEQGKIVITIPNTRENDPNAHLYTRDPAGQSVWEEEEV